MHSEILEKSRDGILLQSLLDYFHNRPDKLKIMMSIILDQKQNTNDNKISLRIIDHFVTNYSKDYIKDIVNNKTIEGLNVHNQYKSQLKMWGKKLFDPFARHASKNKINKFTFYHNNDDHFSTTIGQLNFFKWLLDTNILPYISENIQAIRNDIRNRDSKKGTPHKPVKKKEFVNIITEECFIIKFS